MGIRIEDRQERHLPAIRAFNTRMGAGGISPEFLFSEAPCDAEPRGPVCVAARVAVDDAGEVRGGYIVETRPFQAGSAVVRLDDYQIPISEGLIDRRFVSVGAMLLQHAIRENALLYTVGMGGVERPLPRMLRALRWHVKLVPFLFRVNGATRFLRNIGALRTTAARRTALDMLAATGLGWAGLQMVQARRWGGLPLRHASFAVESHFGDWADAIWEQCKNVHSLAAVRTAEVLNAVYPADGRYGCARVRKGGRDVGWAVTLVSDMRGNKYFGDLRVGTLLDCLAAPDDMGTVAAAAMELLSSYRADVCVTNQADARWAEALREIGFLSGPSNYGVSFSPAVMKLLGPIERAEPRIHITRGDGDGRVNLQGGAEPVPTTRQAAFPG